MLLFPLQTGRLLVTHIVVYHVPSAASGCGTTLAGSPPWLWRTLPRAAVPHSGKPWVFKGSYVNHLVMVQYCWTPVCCDRTFSDSLPYMQCWLHSDVTSSFGTFTVWIGEGRFDGESEVETSAHAEKQYAT